MRLIKFTWDRGEYDVLDVEIHIMRKRPKPGKIGGPGNSKSRIVRASSGKSAEVPFGFTATSKEKR